MGLRYALALHPHSQHTVTPPHSYTHTHTQRHADIHHMGPRHRDPAVWHQYPLGWREVGREEKWEQGGAAQLKWSCSNIVPTRYLSFCFCLPSARSPSSPLLSLWNWRELKLPPLLSCFVLLIESVL